MVLYIVMKIITSFQSSSYIILNMIDKFDRPKLDVGHFFDRIIVEHLSSFMFYIWMLEIVQISFIWLECNLKIQELAWWQSKLSLTKEILTFEGLSIVFSILAQIDRKEGDNHLYCSCLIWKKVTQSQLI